MTKRYHDALSIHIDMPFKTPGANRIPIYIFSPGRLTERRISPKKIDRFTVVCLVTWPLNGSEAVGDLVLIQTSLLLLCKSSCSYTNWLVFTLKKREVCASFASIGQVTKHTTVDWILVFCEVYLHFLLKSPVLLSLHEH